MMNRFVFYFVCLIIVAINLCYCDDGIWYSYQFGSGSRNREEFHVESVSSDESFNFGKNVKSWKSVTIRNKIYAVGLMETGVTILNMELTLDKEKFITTGHVIDFNFTTTDMELFSYWNKELRQMDNFLIVASKKNLYGYKIVKERLDLIFTWSLNHEIVKLKHFKLVSEDNLLVTSKNGKLRTVGLYKLKVDPIENNFWLIQSFSFRDLKIEVEVNYFGSLIFLSFAQENSSLISVYKYSGCQFVSYQNISNLHVVSHISSFKIGFKSFLAVGGQEAAIYQFTKKGIVKEKLNFNIYNAFTWLPIPAKTYRDDVILIFQRNVPHGSHTSHFLEVLFYNNEEFKIHDEIQCTLHGEVEHGLGCMVDFATSFGLLESTVLSLGNLLGVIVPGREHSVLFYIETTLRDFSNSVDSEIESMKSFKTMWDEKLYVQDNFKHVLNNYFRQNPLKSEAELVDFRTKNKLVSDSLKLENNSHTSPSDDVIVGKPFQHNEILKFGMIKNELQQLKREVKKIKSDIEYAQEKLYNAVKLNDSQITLQKLIVNGKVSVGGTVIYDKVFSDTLNGEDIDYVINDTARASGPSLIMSHKTFSNLHAESLTFDNLVNPSDDTLKGNRIKFNRDVEFLNFIHIKNNVTATSEKVNDFNFPDDIVVMEKLHEEPFQFEDIRVNDTLITDIINGVSMINLESKRGDSNSEDVSGLETLTVFGNIIVEQVNGIDFEDFLKSLCLKNIETHISGDTIIDGELIVDGELTTDFLNEISYPEEYGTANMGFAKISGHKIFEGVVFAGEVGVDQTINGIPVDSLIRFNSEEPLPEFTFQNLEVLNLYLKGTLDHPLIKDLKPSPTLRHANVINVTTHFQNLNVNGNVILSKNYNGKHIGNQLKEIVYIDEEEAVIDSLKVMNRGLTVTEGIKVKSKYINNVPLDSFITKNTEQELVLETLNGSVSFENLFITGLFGGINIDDLEKSTVRLNSDQTVSSTLIFQNTNDEADLTATEFTILKTLNNLTAKDFFYTSDQSRTFPYEVNFDSVKADTVRVDGNITAKISNFSIEDFDNNRLSLTRNQTVTAKYKIENLTCENLKSSTLNGNSFLNYFGIDKYTDQFLMKLQLDDKIHIKSLEVHGSIFAKFINNENITQYQINMWKNKSNHFDTAVIEGDVFLKSLNAESLNGYNLNDLSENIVFKTAIVVDLNGFKNFKNGLKVFKFLNAERLNGVHVDHVLRKTGNQILAGPLNIKGNIFIDSDFEVLGSLNGVWIINLLDTYEFVDNEITCIIKDDVYIDRIQYINHFLVEGKANNKDVKELINNLVFKGKNANISGVTTFIKKVLVKQNLTVAENINDIKFSEYVEDMVFIMNDSDVQGDVVFVEPVTINGTLIVESSLQTSRLYGIDLERWINDAVYVNHGRILGKLTFGSVVIHNDINVNFCNGFELKTLIPLRTQQTINKTLIFKELTPFHNISVKNSINNLNLTDEIANSLLMTSDFQEVQSKIAFYGNVMVRDKFLVEKINNKSIDHVVTLNTNQSLTGSYTFKDEVEFRSNLQVDELINGINISDWNSKSVKTISGSSQVLEGNWFTDGNVTFMEDVDSAGSIGEVDLKEMAITAVNTSAHRSLITSQLLADYIKLCDDINESVQSLKNQIYQFKYFDVCENCSIRFNYNSKDVFYFVSNMRKYVIVFREDCYSEFFEWQEHQFKYLGAVQTGSVLDIITVYHDNSVFFVTKADRKNPNCYPEGTNVWEFENNHLKLLSKMEDCQTLQASLIPGTFYTLNHGVVTQYSINSIKGVLVKPHRKWKMRKGTYEFIPNGLGAGLALTNGSYLFKLRHDNTDIEEEYGYNTDFYTWGNVLEQKTFFYFKPVESHMIVLNVGAGEHRRSIVAVTFEEDTVVKGRFYFIKIYEDILGTNIFQVIPTYKPSSLLSVEFKNNGETLLLFLENNEYLQIFEYKGIEGFRHRARIPVKAEKLIKMSLSFDGANESKVVGLKKRNSLEFLKAVMIGNQFKIEEQLCFLSD